MSESTSESTQLAVAKQTQVQIKRGKDEKFCENCGHIVKKDAKFCSNCGSQNTDIQPLKQHSDKSWLTTLFLTIFPVTGLLGIHRFYSGRIGSGFLWMITGGGAVFGWLYDILAVCMGEFKDGDGRIIDWLDDDDEDDM